MGVLKRLSRAPRVQRALGSAAANYLRLVRRTNRFVLDPPDAYARYEALAPCIFTMWHGQHILLPLLRRPQDRVATMISRSADGEVNALALQHLGIRVMRGSGARGRDVRRRGGTEALLGAIRGLRDGETMVVSADFPKIARRCEPGIVTLARLSGRAILPTAVVTSRRLEFRSWDRATLGLPFGRGAMVVGAPIHVPRDADEVALEAARRAVETELARVQARAFALVGRRDPMEGIVPGSARP